MLVPILDTGSATPLYSSGLDATARLRIHRETFTAALLN